MVITLVFAFTGCMPSGNSTNAVAKDELVLPTKRVESEESEKEEMILDIKEVSEKDFDKNIEGLCEYLAANYSVVGEKVQTSYDVINAKDGYRYYFKYNKSVVQLEVYEFDLENMDKETEDNLKLVKETGKLKVVEAEVDAVINDEGNFVMLYIDASKDQTNIDQKERTVELFKKF